MNLAFDFLVRGNNAAAVRPTRIGIHSWFQTLPVSAAPVCLASHTIPRYPPPMLGPHPFRLFANPRLGTPGITVLPAAGFRRAKAEITAWPGYTEIPRDIMQGYRLMADEAADQWTGPPPTHVFIQGGVGGAAASVSVQCRSRFAPAPALIVVEPDRAACLLASAEFGERVTIPGDLDTVMAGLACGEPSLLGWQELDRAAAAFMAIPDEAAVACLRLLATQRIVAGESGVAGLAGCLLAIADPAARATLGLDATSRVLLFSTEGATDPELYAKLAGVSAAHVSSRHG
jgi:threonine dehydratase